MRESIPVETANRLDGLNQQERAVLHAACVELADGIMADAEAEEIDPASLADAAATFLQALTLAHELDPESPDPEAAALMAGVIAEGDAPLASKMAREAAAENVGHPYYPDSDGRPIEGDQSALGPIA